ncbi:MAG: hypothetical protein OEZ01_11615 [Candidatus Heimdallarchaeota archaeon]|nr:hypothetical protein [Candidatus Heimdallarchaeota archaeon]MDH5646650.1 hypothetical protein [Candidatus Heimdallarchaeota archaeon]
MEFTPRIRLHSNIKLEIREIFGEMQLKKPEINKNENMKYKFFIPNRRE